MKLSFKNNFIPSKDPRVTKLGITAIFMSKTDSKTKEAY